MDRRKSLKAIFIGSLTTSVIVGACKDLNKVNNAPLQTNAGNEYRMKEEIKSLEKIAKEDKFFNENELKSLHILADIIIPKDDVSGSANDAKVVEFIEFTVLDRPNYQVSLRGGLSWLDMHCLKKYSLSFSDCSKQQQLEIVDMIAYPKKAKPEMRAGVSFFNTLRDLVVTGFYTSEIGVTDLGFKGNAPNQWNGVPDDVLKQYNLSYTKRELTECIQFNNS